MEEIFAGIDVGLSGVRASLVTKHGRLVSRSRIASNTYRLSATEICRLGLSALKHALAKRHDKGISCLAIACAGPSPVLLGRNDRELKRVPLFHWGTRADQTDDLRARLLGARTTWPKVFKKAHSVADLTGFAVGHCTGTVVMDHGTKADYSAADEGLRLATPDAHAAKAISGELQKSTARRLGIASGAPVATGCYDSTADIAAAGFGSDRSAVIVIGSTLVLGRLTTEPIKDVSLRSISHLGDGWFSGGWTNMAGSALRLADQWLAKGGERESKHTPLVLPYFAGERAPVWSLAASGSALGLTSCMKAADLRRGVLEGAVLSALDIADRLAEELGPVRSWTVTGGGTRSPSLMQALSDALGARLNVVRHAADAIGPALLAASACGHSIRLPIAQSWRPRRMREAYFKRRLALYRHCHAALTPLYGELRSGSLAGGERT